MKKTIFFSLILICICACKKDKSEGSITTDAAFADELRNSPDTLNLAGNQLTLSTYLWRNYMPSNDENASNLHCIASLNDLGQQTINGSIILKRNYVIFGDQIWSAEYSGSQLTESWEIEGSVSNGPKWGHGNLVDCVCEFEVSGITYRICSKTEINAVY